MLNEDGSHGEIVNIGAPFNTWLDDYGFILTASGDDAFFVREGDIYYAYTKDASPELKPSASTLMLAGKIRDAKTLKGMEAKITVKDANGQVIAEGSSNSLTGEYALIIPVQYKSFQQLVSKPDYDGFSKSFQITLKPGLNKVVSDVNLNKPAPATLLIAGKVLDEKTLQPLEARIQIKDPTTGTVLAEGRSNPQTGAYSLSIPAQNPGFVQEVYKLEYEDFEKSFQISLKPGPNQVNSDVKLRKAGPVEAAAEYGKPDFDLR
ncbi:MAG: hypothetical protein HC913_14230 [Microscillaceae bacterium]|nr:hypothetical protein [Microscillaceae bacterium]